MSISKRSKDFPNSALSDAVICFLGEQSTWSSRTLALKTDCLREAVIWFAEQGIQQWEELTPRMVQLYLSARHQPREKGQGTGTLSANSLQIHLSALRLLCDALLRTGQINHNPARLIKGPKVRHKLPQILDVDQLGALLDHSPNQPLEVRDIAMLELFYSCGLRRAELAGLSVAMLDIEQGLLRIARGKGNKTRIVPVGRMALNAVQQWLIWRPHFVSAVSGDALFLSRRGHPLSDRQIANRVKRWASVHHATTDLHPHKLRHCFASHLLESSGDIRAVQELLGHANIGTTQVYTHLDFQHLAQVYDAAHPKSTPKKTDKPDS